MSANQPNTGGPAFPLDGANAPTGMTLRDYFAAKAMQTLISQVKSERDVQSVAPAAYRMADEMLKARNQ